MSGIRGLYSFVEVALGRFRFVEIALLVCQTAPVAPLSGAGRRAPSCGPGVGGMNVSIGVRENPCIEENLSITFRLEKGPELLVAAVEVLIRDLEEDLVGLPRDEVQLDAFWRLGRTSWSRFLDVARSRPFYDGCESGRFVLSCCGEMEHRIRVIHVAGFGWDSDLSSKTIDGLNHPCYESWRSTSVVGISGRSNEEEVVDGNRWLRRYTNPEQFRTWTTTFGVASRSVFDKAAEEFSWDLPGTGDAPLTDYEFDTMLTWGRRLFALTADTTKGSF